MLLLIRTAEPLGRRKYWPIYEAAVEHGLPVGIHFGGWGGGPITGRLGSFYIEDHGGMATAFQAQVTSFVFEGVFEQFPELKIVLIEGGFAWLPPLMWRLDRAWEQLRARGRRTLDRLPSEIIREHVWLTTQPMEEPPRRQDFPALLEQIGMDDRLMFATDYPHWDFDAPDRALPSVARRGRPPGDHARATPARCTASS